MSFPPPNGQAVVTVTDITDPTCAGAGTELIDLDAVQLQSTPFLARRIIVRTGEASVLFHSTNHRVRTRTKIGERQIAYCVFGPRAQGTLNGLPVRPGLMVALAANVESRVVVNSNWETTTFLLPPGFVHAHLAGRQRADEYREPRGIEMLEVKTSSALRLFDWGKQLAETAAEHASLFNEYQDGLPAIQFELVENLLATLGSAHGLKPCFGDRTRQKRSLIVKIAEDYALSQSGINLYVTDLCRIAGVCERTLEYAFQEIMGLTPMAFLSRLRLHRVRHELLLAMPGATTIAKEALRWGFWHFGDFSRAYKDCFGELPSDTLSRQ